jgi:hypothetical protein
MTAKEHTKILLDIIEDFHKASFSGVRAKTDQITFEETEKYLTLSYALYVIGKYVKA